MQRLGVRYALFAVLAGVAVLSVAVVAAGTAEPPPYDTLTDAVLHGDRDAARRLIDDGADLDRRSGGVRPLWAAAAAGDEAMVGLLLERGANATLVQGGDFYGPLYEAARAGSLPVIRLLAGARAELCLGTLRFGTLESPAQVAERHSTTTPQRAAAAAALLRQLARDDCDLGGIEDRPADPGPTPAGSSAPSS